MPLYDFECEPCAYYAEIRQGYNDPSTLECPHCNKNTLKKVFITAPYVAVRGEPETVKHLAERNTQKMGTYELQSKMKEDKIEERNAKREKVKLNRKINNMTPQEKIKWIENGE
jgi:putative FmdB family regulatory protein